MLEIAHCPACQAWLQLPTEPPDMNSASVMHCAACSERIDLAQLRREVQVVYQLERRVGDVDSTENLPSDRVRPLDIDIPSPFHGAAGESSGHLPVSGGVEGASRVDERDRLPELPAARNSIEIRTEPATDGRSRPVARRRSRGKSPFWEFIKVALGGVAGLVLAQLILWWAPGGQPRDPFGIARRLPIWVQPILPVELRRIDDNMDPIWNAPPGASLGKLLNADQNPEPSRDVSNEVSPAVDAVDEKTPDGETPDGETLGDEVPSGDTSSRRHPRDPFADEVNVDVTETAKSAGESLNDE